jgi:hypothetical protein
MRKRGRFQTSFNPYCATSHGLAAVSCASARACTNKRAVRLWCSHAGRAMEPCKLVSAAYSDADWSVGQRPPGVSCPTRQTCVAVGQSSRFNAATNSRGRPVALAEQYSADDD